MSMVFGRLINFVITVTCEDTGKETVKFRKPRVSVNPKLAIGVGPVPDQALETLSELKPQVVCPDLQSYLPFISAGCVSLVGSEEK